jgi:hypothetical protein
MMWMKTLFLFFVLLWLCSCVHSGSPRSDIYVHPEQYVGQSVSVCGYIVDSANIVESADREDRTRRGGLSIVERGPLNPLRRGWTCLEGEIVHFGCGSGPRICLEAVFDYAIKIRRVAVTR